MKAALFGVAIFFVGAALGLLIAQSVMPRIDVLAYMRGDANGCPLTLASTVFAFGGRATAVVDGGQIVKCGEKYQLAEHAMVVCLCQ